MNDSATASEFRHQKPGSSGSEQKSSTHGHSSSRSHHTPSEIEAQIDMMLLEGKVVNLLYYGKPRQMPPAYLMRSTDVRR